MSENEQITIIGIDFGGIELVLSKAIISNNKISPIEIVENSYSQKKTKVSICFSESKTMIGRDGYIFSAKYYNRRIDPPKTNIFVKEGIMTIRLQNQQIQVNQICSTSYILFLHHIYQFINAKPQFVGISIPSYYSVEQIIRVISIYGFLPPANMLILPEYVSNVLNFCFCNSIRNDSEERNIVIVDVGYTYGSSTLFRVNKDSCEILSHNYTRNIGGEEIDKLLMNYIKNYLKEECNINSISPRNEVNILHKMIEAKEKLSAEGANKIVVTFENLYEDNDDDISIDFTVQELNEIIKDIAQNLNKIFESSLFQKLNNNEMQNLEICVVGGTMRIPFLQNTLKMFMKDIYNNNRNINYTINMDENVAYGNICFIFQHLKYWNFTFKDSSGSKINENIGNAVDKRERCDLIFQSASELINQLNNYNEISSERNNLEGKIYKVEHLAENNERKKIILDKLQPFQEFYEKNSNNKTKLQKQNKRIDNLIDRINLNRSLSLTPESADESSYSSVTSSSSSTLSSSTTTLSVSTATEATKPRRKSNTSNNDNHNNPINTLSAAKYDKIEDVVKSKAPSPQSASTIHNIMKEESPKSNHSDKSKQLEKSSSLSSSIENLMSEDDDQLLSRQEQQQQYQEEEEEQQQQQKHEQQEQVSFSKPLPPAASLKDEMYNKIEDVIKNDSIIIPSGSISEDSFINSNTNSPLLNPSPIKFPSNLSTSVSSSAVNSNNYNNNDSYEMNNNSDENPEEKVEIENTPFVTKRKDLLSSQKSDSKPYNDGDNTTLSELNEQLTFTDNNNNNNNTTTTTQSTLSLVKDKLSGVRSNSSSSFSSNSFVSPITPPPVQQQQQQSVIKSSGILPPPPPLEPLQKNELSSQQQQQQQSEIKSIPSSSRSSSESSVGNETTLNNIHHNLQSPMGIKEDNNNIQQLPPQLQEQNKIHSTNTLLSNDTNNTTNKSLTFITTNLDSNSELPPLKSPQKSPQHSFGSFQPQPQPLIQPKPKLILLQKQILPHQYLPPLAPPKKTLETTTTQTTPPELPKVKEYSVIDMVIDKNLYSESCYKLEVNSEMNTFDTVPLIYRTVFTVQPILNYKSMNQL